MLFTTPGAPSTIAAPSFKVWRPIWLGAGLADPDPVPVVPLLVEYRLAFPLAPRCFFCTELRWRLNIPPSPLNRLSAENALLMLPMLDSEAPPTDVGAELAR